MRKLIVCAALLLFLVAGSLMTTSAQDCYFCYTGWIYNGHFDGPCSGDRYFCQMTGASLWECDGGTTILVDNDGTCELDGGGTGPGIILQAVSIGDMTGFVIRPHTKLYRQLRAEARNAKFRAMAGEQRCDADCFKTYRKVLEREAETNRLIQSLVQQ